MLWIWKICIVLRCCAAMQASINCDQDQRGLRFRSMRSQLIWEMVFTSKGRVGNRLSTHLDQPKTVSTAGCGRSGSIARANQVHAYDSDLLDQATDHQRAEILNVQRGLWRRLALCACLGRTFCRCLNADNWCKSPDNKKIQSAQAQLWNSNQLVLGKDHLPSKQDLPKP